MMIPKFLQQRSSWLSSLLTGLIGWNGFVVIVPLALGYTQSLRPLLLVASGAAVIQVVVLRLVFVPLRMHRSLVAGAIWGGLTAVPLVLRAGKFCELVGHHSWIAMVTGVYVGIPIGTFLAYFHRDDRKIEAEAIATGVAVDYGRDAHWLDPFIYGAVCYLIAGIPLTVDAVISCTTVGSIVGVFAAGVSHFGLSRWNNAIWTIPALALLGLGLGTATGILFRNYGHSLGVPYLVVGALGGMLTCVVTATMGRHLSLKEAASQPITKA